MSVLIYYKKPERIKSAKRLILENQLGSMNDRFKSNDTYYNDSNHDEIIDKLIKSYTKKEYYKQTVIRITGAEAQNNKTIIEDLKKIMEKLGWDFVCIAPYTFTTHHEARSYQVERTYKGRQEYTYKTHETDTGTHVERSKAYDTVYEPAYTHSELGYELQFVRDNVDEKYIKKSEKYNKTCHKISDIMFYEGCSNSDTKNGVYEAFYGKDGYESKIPGLFGIFTCFIIPFILYLINMLLKSQGNALSFQGIIVFFGVSIISVLVGIFKIIYRNKIIKKIITRLNENDREIERLYNESLRILDEE